MSITGHIKTRCMWDDYYNREEVPYRKTCLRYWYQKQSDRRDRRSVLVSEYKMTKSIGLEQRYIPITLNNAIIYFAHQHWDTSSMLERVHLMA